MSMTLSELIKRFCPTKDITAVVNDYPKPLEVNHYQNVEIVVESDGPCSLHITYELEPNPHAVRGFIELHSFLVRTPCIFPLDYHDANFIFNKYRDFILYDSPEEKQETQIAKNALSCVLRKKHSVLNVSGDVLEIQVEFYVKDVPCSIIFRYDRIYGIALDARFVHAASKKTTEIELNPKQVERSFHFYEKEIMEEICI